MTATSRSNPRRLALSVVLGQVAVTMLCALVSAVIADGNAAISALLGGGISALASLVMALLSFGSRPAQDPYQAIRAFFTAEAAKVAVVVVLFVLVLKTMKVVPLAMLGTYVATFVVFWVALARSMSGNPPTAGPGALGGRTAGGGSGQ